MCVQLIVAVEVGLAELALWVVQSPVRPQLLRVCVCVHQTMGD